MRVAPRVGLLLVLLCAGCANVPPAMEAEQSQRVAPHSGLATVSPAAETGAPFTTGSTVRSATAAPSASARVPAHGRAPAASASRLPKKDSIGTDIATQKAEPPIDLTTLKKRLKETRAIGVLAKIALRNQVDDLVSQLRAFYLGKLNTTLAELRPPYDLLVFRVIALLQEDDPSLAAAIGASREAIWSILSDPAKFAMI